VGGHDLGVLHHAFALEVISDSGGAQGMVADAGFDSGVAGALRDHPVAVPLRHAVGRCR